LKEKQIFPDKFVSTIILEKQENRKLVFSWLVFLQFYIIDGCLMKIFEDIF